MSIGQAILVILALTDLALLVGLVLNRARALRYRSQVETLTREIQHLRAAQGRPSTSKGVQLPRTRGGCVNSGVNVIRRRPSLP